jgi:hypothetical protein
MRVNIRYVGSSGNKYNLVSDGILHREANYMTWSWSAVGTKLQYGQRIANFSRNAASYKTTLLFYGLEPKRRALIDAMHDEFERDLRDVKPGRLYWGDWHIDCFIIASDTQPTNAMSCTSNDITIFAPHPFWQRDITYSFPKQERTEGDAFLDYQYDYEYDYSRPVIGEKTIARSFPFKSDFKMVIYGTAVNPRITINGYTYVFYMTIGAGEYLEIDSREKTVMLYGTDGAQTNAFDNRNKAESVFEKIPGDNLQITWDATFGFELTIHHERSEPRIEVT